MLFSDLVLLSCSYRYASSAKQMIEQLVHFQVIEGTYEGDVLLFCFSNISL